MKKLIIIILVMLVPFTLLAAETETVASETVVKAEEPAVTEADSLKEQIEKGFDFDIYLLGHFVRQSNISAGFGMNFGYQYGGVQYDFYMNFEYFFNPGGGPQALGLEMVFEPGLRFEFEFLKRPISSTSFVLDLGYLTSWGINKSFDEKLHLMANGVTVRPGISFNFQFGNYETAVGVFYNAIVYPRGLGPEYDGVMLAIKLY